jgi:hypothetical protein
MIVVPVSKPPESGHGGSAHGPEVIEHVQVIVDARDRDAEFSVGGVVGTTQLCIGRFYSTAAHPTVRASRSRRRHHHRQRYPPYDLSLDDTRDANLGRHTCTN